MSDSVDLKEVLKPGSPNRKDVKRIISKIANSWDTEKRHNALIESAIEEKNINGIDFSKSGTDFAERIINRLLPVDQLYLVLNYLLESDEPIAEDDRQLLTKLCDPSFSIHRQKQSQVVEMIANERAEQSMIGVPGPIKFDIQLLIEFIDYELDEGQISQFLTSQGVFSIYLAGKERIVKQYIRRRLIKDLCRVGILDNQKAKELENQQNYIVFNEYNCTDANTIMKLLDNHTNEPGNICFILVELQRLPKDTITQIFELVSGNRAIQESSKMILFLWYLDLERKEMIRPISKFKKDKKDRRITRLSITPEQINVNRLRTRLQGEIEERIVPDLEKCFKRIEDQGSEFFNAYIVLDDFVTSLVTSLR